ncbi:probable E3 ubiquitin-protein ligase ATL44 [Phragmites australis]|uniref:probable E3 ubiquitin-protein ligase ATL44 n=1 Tax=Phragmites australis TaxID=29695 RepID=UPI002D79B1D7|nr:probable E3 ubiquitin-protein ligase ATL44 [Phragmites australis]
MNAGAVLAVLAAAWAARDNAAGGPGRAAVHDGERTLGAATIMTYAQAAVGNGNGKAEQCCAICLSDYAKADEPVRVVPACGHFFHAGCDVSTSGSGRAGRARSTGADCYRCRSARPCHRESAATRWPSP